MNRDLKVSKSIEINADRESVWEVLTNPEKIKIYLFGTETITDWKVGSPIIFQGDYEGQQYQDKGNVLANVVNETLQYGYWSGFSGLEDIPENYSIITYQIDEVSDGKVRFTWTQEGYGSEEGRKHSEDGMDGLLQQIKEVVEG